MQLTPNVPRRSRHLLSALLDCLGAMIVALVVLTLIFTLFLRYVGVDGDSMLPTLHHGDRLLLYTAGDTYEPGDIIVVGRLENEPLIKRVIAVAGDKVEVTEDGKVVINGTAQKETYIQGENVQRDMEGPVTVPDGHLFVLGDNRTVSKDSRLHEIGFIPVQDVVGKAVLRLWPLESIGGVYKNMTEEAL